MNLIDFFSTSAILALIVIVIATVISHLSDKGKAYVTKVEEQEVLDNLEQEMRARRARQEKTLEEIALYPSESEEGNAAWLFLDTTLSGNMLVELAWMTTDASGHLVDDWHGLPMVNDLENLYEIASKVRGVVMFGMAAQHAAIVAEMRKVNRDDLAASWLQVKTVDIGHGHSSLESLLGKLYLEDENVPVKGLDNAEARALIIFRCFVKMKVKGEV